MNYAGRVVVIPKGTEYRTTHPQKRRRNGESVLGRTIKVKIHHEWGGERADVTWAGTGGYWCWTHPDNVRLAEDDE